MSRRLLPGFALGVFCATTTAQGPVEPPPWWGVNDDVTVSIAWNFDTPFAGPLPPQQPDFESVASWYQNPTPWSASPVSSPLQHLATLNGHQGVCALVGNGASLQADIDLFVDNDPHVDWIKIFWFQADVFPGASGSLRMGIAEDQTKYGRANVTQSRVPIGNGWERWTFSAKLIPQPNDETIEMAFLESANGTVAIDNLYVSSKCIKPRADEDGDALGKIVTQGGQQNVNLTVSTLGRTCRSVAVTLGPGPIAARRYWVGVNSVNTNTQHEVLEVSASGVPINVATPLPATGTVAPLGVLDMTVERRWLANGTLDEMIYALTRTTSGALRIDAIDPDMPGMPNVALSTVVASPAVAFNNQRLGLAFDPSGDNGVGTFWVSGPVGVAGNHRAVEYSRTGVALDNFPLPPDTVGIDYDDALGNFYAFTREPVVTPSGTLVQVNGVEISGYTREETGVRFCGDLNVPGAAGSPGGLASGLTVYRTLHGPRSQLRFACVADAPGAQYFYELAGPFRYGYSRFGRIGMRNGPAFVGGSFDVTLSGVQDSLAAVLFIGISSANIPLGPGIQSEAVGSILPLLSTSAMPPTSPGEFAATIQWPPAASIAYAETFYQWVVVDSTAPGFLGFTQAGKTVIYP